MGVHPPVVPKPSPVKPFKRKTTISTSDISKVSGYSTQIISQVMVAYPVIAKIIANETVRLYSIKKLIKSLPKKIKKAKKEGEKKLVKKLVKKAKAAAKNKKDCLRKIRTAIAQKKILLKAKVTAKVSAKIAVKGKRIKNM